MSSKTLLKSVKNKPDGILLQEYFSDDPWKCIVCCIFLNLTTFLQVRLVIDEFFALCPGPNELLAAETKDVKNLIAGLGLVNRRYETLRRFSKEWLQEWTHPLELHGVGKYADDSFKIFVEGRTKDIWPTDSILSARLDRLKSESSHIENQ